MNSSPSGHLVDDVAPRLVVVDPDYALACWNDTFCVIWRVNTTVEGGQALHRECDAFAATRPKGIALITIVEEGAPMPPSDARQEIARFLGEASSYIKASAVVFEGSGFRAAAVRSVVIGLTMLARQKYPHKVFATLEEAAAWQESELRNRLEYPFSADDTCRALAIVRSQLSSRRRSTLEL